MVDDPGQSGSNNRRRGNRKGSGGNIIGALLPIIFKLFRKNPKMAIVLLILGGGYYFFFVRGSNSSLEHSLVSALGCDMSPEVYEKSEIYEPLAIDYKSSIPGKVSLTKYCPSRRNQGQQGSCVGWASSYAARTILHSRATGKNPNEVAFSPASLYNQISLPNCQGAYIHNAMDVMKKNGVLPWRDFGYDESSCSQKLNGSHLDKASQFTTKGFQRLWKTQGEVDIHAIKQNLAQEAPVVIGMMVGGSFMQNMRGKNVWKPTSRDYAMRGFGGHAMCVIGYDDNKKAFQLMNSWGPEWGDNGLAWVSYSDFAHFTKEAYGLYPMGQTQDQVSADFDVEFGLMNNQSKSNIQLEETTQKSLFRTKNPVKKGSTFKIEVTNKQECYTYVFGQETDGSSYVLFPYSDKHSPYCGIVGTRLFPRYQSLQADEVGSKDYMAVIITKEPLDFKAFNEAINKSKWATYYDKVKYVIRNMESSVSYEVGNTIHLSQPSNKFKMASMIFEIEKD